MTEDIFHLGIKALLRDKTGKILLLRVNPAKLSGKQRDYWDLPGGRVQKGQTVTETLEREVAEETGLTAITIAKEAGMVLSNIRIPLAIDDSAGLILGIYECAVTGHEEIELSDEHVAFDWFEPQEAATLLQVKYSEHFCRLVSAL